MGRPLIYICAITTIVLGIVQLSLNERHISLVKRTATYANEAEIRNMAHAGVEYTLNKLRTDTDWRNNYEPYEVALDYGTADVTIEDESTNSSLGKNELRLISVASLHGETTTVNYKVKIVYPKLPSIPGALALTDPNFLTELDGSFYINGLDEAGVDDGLPGITVIDEPSKDQIIAKDPTYKFLDQVDGNTNTTDDEPSIKVDPTMDFDPLAEMIDKLAPVATRLSGGPYTSGDLGSESSPGVFLVEDYAKITSNTNGYGIMIVRENADLDVETTVNVAGTFNFHGLVLFENSWALDGQGDVTIHGTVVVGSPDETSPTTTIDLTGNLTIQYNSIALEYARRAASKGVAASFEILDIYE